MIRRAAPAVVAACLCLLASPASAQGPDELWEVTAKVTVEGMSMPAMPTKVCKKKDDNMPPAEKNCRTYDIKTSGNRTTWRTECTGENAMSGTGEMTRGKGSYTAKLAMKSKDAGNMTMDYAGRLVGKCNAR
jgi:hypothetical protein